MAKDKQRTENGWAEQLPPEVEGFLRRVVDSSIMCYDILSFFYHNPYAIVTISDLTIWMSRTERPLADTLQQLAKLGYLAQSHASAAYVLTPDKEKRGEIEAFFGYLEDNPEVATEIRRRTRQGREGD